MSVQTEISQKGYKFFKCLLPGQPTSQVLPLLGKAISLSGSDAIHPLTPKHTSCAPPNTYSGIYGCNAFPMHTDLAHWYVPPRYFLLRCIKGIDEVGTLLIDGARVIDRCGEQLLSRSLVRPRRPIGGKLALLRLYQSQLDSPGLLRWDERFIRSASPAGTAGMARMTEAIQEIKAERIELSEPGDTLVVDNWRMIHGRSAVPEGSMSRVIERVYLGALN